jgi:hypothetical protein
VLLPRASRLRIGGLEPNQQYAISGRSIAVSGPSFYQSFEVYATTKPETFSVGIIVGICIAALVFLILLAACFYTCCRLVFTTLRHGILDICLLFFHIKARAKVVEGL